MHIIFVFWYIDKSVSGAFELEQTEFVFDYEP